MNVPMMNTAYCAPEAMRPELPLRLAERKIYTTVINVSGAHQEGIERSWEKCERLP